MNLVCQNETRILNENALRFSIVARPLPILEYIRAVSTLIGAAHIVAVFEETDSLKIYFDDRQYVDTILVNCIHVMSRHVRIDYVISPGSKVIMTNVDPVLPDFEVMQSLLAYGSIVSPIIHPPICDDTELCHIKCGVRYVYMVIHETLPYKVEFRYGDQLYNIRLHVEDGSKLFTIPFIKIEQESISEIDSSTSPPSLDVFVGLSSIDSNSVGCENSDPVMDSVESTAYVSISQVEAFEKDSQLEGSVNDLQFEASERDSQSAGSINDIQFDASKKDSQLEASVNDSQLEASVNDSQLEASVNETQLEASVNESQLEASVNELQLEASVHNSQLRDSVNDPQACVCVDDPQPNASINSPQPNTSISDIKINSITSLTEEKMPIYRRRGRPPKNLTMVNKRFIKRDKSSSPTSQAARKIKKNCSKSLKYHFSSESVLEPQKLVLFINEVKHHRAPKKLIKKYLGDNYDSTMFNNFIHQLNRYKKTLSDINMRARIWRLVRAITE